MTSTIVGWIDVFSRERYRQIIVDSLRYCQKGKKLHVVAFVIMTNHIHLIAWVEAPFEMSAVMRDFKAHTAREILKSIENDIESRKEWLIHVLKFFGNQSANRKTYQFWQDGFHPVQLWSDAVFMQKLNYLHQNPVRAGLVLRAEDWVYSSASNYHNQKGILEVDIWWPSQFITI